MANTTLQDLRERIAALEAQYAGQTNDESLKPGQCACGLYFNQTCSRQPCLRAAPRFPQAVCPHGAVMAELCHECYPKTAEQVERKGE